jgi:zinc transport system substrate-binding protein
MPLVLMFLLWCTLFACPIYAGFPQGGSAPQIAVSTQPIWGIVQAVTQDITTPMLILDKNLSLHDYQLRPSDIAKFKQADLVILVDRKLERFMEPAMSNYLSSKAEMLELAHIPGVKKLPLLPPLYEDHSYHDDHDHDHHDASIDGHIWLAPANARAIAAFLAERLAVLDPRHASQYRHNAKQFMLTLDTLEASINATLAPVRGRGFVAFHDSYRYFADAFSLRYLGGLTINPDSMPSAKTLLLLKQQIAANQVVCLCGEPQFSTRVMAHTAKETRTKYVVMDPEWHDITEGSHSYVSLMTTLAQRLQGCLSPE